MNKGTKRRKRRTKRRSAPRRNVTNRRTSVASKGTKPTHFHCVTKNDAPLLRHKERRTSLASRRTKEQSFPTKERLLPTKRRTSVASRRTTHLRCDETKRNGVPHLDGTNERTNPAYERTKRTNETAFALPLQRHEQEHDPQDHNESHEQRRRPLN